MHSLRDGTVIRAETDNGRQSGRKRGQTQGEGAGVFIIIITSHYIIISAYQLLTLHFLNTLTQAQKNTQPNTDINTCIYRLGVLGGMTMTAHL